MVKAHRTLKKTRQVTVGHSVVSHFCGGERTSTSVLVHTRSVVAAAKAHERGPRHRHCLCLVSGPTGQWLAADVRECAHQRSEGAHQWSSRLPTARRRRAFGAFSSLRALPNSRARSRQIPHTLAATAGKRGPACLRPQGGNRNLLKGIGHVRISAFLAQSYFACWVIELDILLRKSPVTSACLIPCRSIIHF